VICGLGGRDAVAYLEGCGVLEGFVGIGEGVSGSDEFYQS
jgi:hypothetical protein